MHDVVSVAVALIAGALDQGREGHQAAAGEHERADELELRGRELEHAAAPGGDAARVECERPELDPYAISGKVALALLLELMATASIMGRS